MHVALAEIGYAYRCPGRVALVSATIKEYILLKRLRTRNTCCLNMKSFKLLLACHPYTRDGFIRFISVTLITNLIRDLLKSYHQTSNK